MRLEEAFPGAMRVLGDEGENRQNLTALLAGMRRAADRLERGVARMGRELEKRGIANPDAYADERDLLGDASFDFGANVAVDDLAFQAAFRGSPHTFDRLSTANVGTGAGRMRGWGIYLSLSADRTAQATEILGTVVSVKAKRPPAFWRSGRPMARGLR
ncbi:MAG: hypothetical protein KF689_02350 [Gemmatimonadaceae bacterium]|nr:hypothetical protein [Gemmatimonadaceae bacterium]MCW5826777.1 hypothetical protein [Gemmatimonadaceae bacterium]